MYSWLKSLLMMVFVLCLQGCNQSNDGYLPGTWEGSREGLSSIVVTFSQDGTCAMTIMGDENEATLIEGKFEADFTKSPIALSIRGISKIDHPLHTLIEFKDANHLRMGGFAHKWRLRPVSFTPESEIWLTRQTVLD